MTVSVIPYGGWQNCLRIANAEIELIITLDVGPRIIRLGFIGGSNEFAEYPDQAGLVGGTTYRSYGGHRLWAAPETKGWTDHPDNNPVEWKEKDDNIILTAPIEQGTKLQKEFDIYLDPNRNCVRIIHKITNCSKAPIKLAPWAVSVMAPGGRAIIPQEPFIPHADRVLPVRPLVLWSYTQMRDLRWTWGNRFIQLLQDSNAKSPQKFGALVTKGWTAYANSDRVFIKRFQYDAKETYPDFGCNVEFFTNIRMLEIESLGPLITLKPQAYTIHREEWYLFRNVEIGEMEESIEQTLVPLVEHASL